MPAANYLPDVLETTEAERLATGSFLLKARYGIRGAIGISSIFARTNFSG